MKEKRFVVALGALSAALTACGSEIQAPPPGSNPGTGGTSTATGGTGGTATGGTATGGTATGGTATGGTATGGTSTGGTATGGTGTGGTSTGGTATGGTGGDAGGAPPTCVPGVPSSSQIPRLRNWQYDAVMRDLLNTTTLAEAEGKAPSTILYPDYTGPMNVDSWRLYQDTAAKIAHEVLTGPNRNKFISCDPAAAGCLASTVETFGRKAFRRPLTPDELTRFAKLGQTTPVGTAEEVAEATLLAFLVSPSFLQITEFTSVPEGTAIKLSSFEVAARLSFLLWGSVPDDTLNAAADADQLTTKDQILAQAQRMIAVKEKTATLISGFHRHYVDMDNGNSHWWKIQHDTTKYPLYNAAIEPTFMAELDSFFAEVAFGGGSFKDLFLSNVGFVTKATAPIYGLDPAAYGDTLTRVELDKATRPGFLTRLGFLQSYSHFDGTSPILRGAYITVNLIGVNPGEPDPNAFLTPAPPGDYKTERAYVEALTGQAACRGCHIPLVNPPGFVLENYDSIGKWQTVDPRGDAINAVADVTFAEGDVKTISTPLQLMEELGKGENARRIYAEKWVQYATGRGSNPNDQCTVDTLNTKLATDGYTILTLLGDLTQSDSFRLRVRETP